MKIVNENLKGKSGVYIITNLISSKRYVGSSKDLYTRLNHHVWDLLNNYHINTHLLNAWNKYGSDAFDYGILELCPEKNRLYREGYYIQLINPEYNLDVVNLTGDLSKTDETKEKISKSIKTNWENWDRLKTCKSRNIQCYVYSIRDWELYVDGDNIINTSKFLGLKYSFDSKFLDNRISGDFVVLSKKFSSKIELKNYVCKNLLKYNSKNFKEDKYLIAEFNGELHYYKTIQQLLNDIKCSCKSTINQHSDATIDNPYIPKNTDIKIYFSKEFIEYEAVPDEKSLGVLSGNIGESPEMDNPEISSEITKGSEPSYSVGGE